MIDIVIVGAGISGLTCARELSTYGNHINLVILEASDRIGGRVRTMKADDGTTLDLGAHFIHGTKENPIYDFAVNKGIVKNDRDINGISSKTVKCFPEDVVSTCPEEVMTQAVAIGEDYIEEFKSEMIDMSTKESMLHYKTVGEFLLKRFDITVKKYTQNQHLFNTLTSVFLSYINKEKIESCCTSLYDLDFRGFLNYIDLEGDHVAVSNHCQNGFEDIIKAIVNDIRIDCVQLNCEVDRIEKVIVNGISKIKLSCNNGKVFYSDTTVLTVSAGVLKHFLKSNVFTIDLPKRKLLSIQKLHLGCIIKIYFKFVTPIQNDISSFEFYPSPNAVNMSNFMRDTHTYEINRVGCSDWWVYWLVCNEGFKLEDPVEYLNNKIISLSNMYPKFPANKVVVDDIVVSDWVTNRFYRGCYSYLKTGADERDIENLAEPVSYGEANLLFAGEATSRHFFSTTHGAYLSGIREAENIKSIYELI